MAKAPTYRAQTNLPFTVLPKFAGYMPAKQQGRDDQLTLLGNVWGPDNAQLGEQRLYLPLAMGDVLVAAGILRITGKNDTWGAPEIVVARETHLRIVKGEIPAEGKGRAKTKYQLQQVGQDPYTGPQPYDDGLARTVSDLKAAAPAASAPPPAAAPGTGGTAPSPPPAAAPPAATGPGAPGAPQPPAPAPAQPAPAAAAAPPQEPKQPGKPPANVRRYFNRLGGTYGHTMFLAQGLLGFDPDAELEKAAQGPVQAGVYKARLEAAHAMATSMFIQACRDGQMVTASEMRHLQKKGDDDGGPE